MTNHKPETGAVSTFTRDDYRRLATRIKEQRNVRGWKQRELSLRAGVSADRLSRLERGAPIRVDELVALSRAFGLGIDDLVFAPPGGAPREEADELARKVLGMIPLEDLPPLIRLLRALAAGLRACWTAEPKGDPE
jgi:transcriptional regulator with XRE-family HTH domain